MKVFRMMRVTIFVHAKKCAKALRLQFRLELPFKADTRFGRTLAINKKLFSAYKPECLCKVSDKIYFYFLFL